MRIDDAFRYVKVGLYETIFTLKANAFTIIAFSIFVIIYMPLAVYNLIHSESLAILPDKARLQVALPIISINNILLSLLISIIVSTSIEQEKTSQILEYLLAYSPYSVGELLLIKLLSSLMLGVLNAIPYAILIYLIINMYINASLSLLLWLTLSIMLSVISFTFIMLLIALMLDVRYASIIRFLAILAVFFSLSFIMRGIQKEQAVLNLSIVTSRITGPLYIMSLIILVVSAILYYMYKDKIIELSMR